MQSYTFWQLANQYKIEIPIVQRDYAQGRGDEKSKAVRNKFLDDLFDCLKQNRPIELDFIYGEVSNDIFIPIDGQQRLTTLFLLHWYLGTRAKKREVKKISFSYKTRISARIFCDKLIAEINSFDILCEKLSDNIKNSFWYFHSWEKDPTVKAMLNTLDSIHYKLLNEDVYDMWQKLIVPNSNLISFNFLNLKDFNLSDELYLKMNARGRGLSDFENFKAWLIGETDNLLKEASGKTIDYKKKWCDDESGNECRWHKLFDKDWTDWLWKNRNIKTKIDSEDKFDMVGIYFIKNISFLAFFVFQPNLNSDIKAEEIEERKIIYDEYLSKNDAITFLEKNYKKIYFDIEVVDFLFSAFEVISNKLHDLKIILPELWTKTDQGFRDSVLNNSTFEFRSYLYAIVQFYGSNLNRLGFEQWFRVVRNLIANTDINQENFKNILDSIKKLSIENNLLETLFAIKGFNNNQIDEEKLKLDLIDKKDSDWEKEIIDTENHPLFKGNIRFLLPNLLNSSFAEFKTRAIIAKKLFDDKGDAIDKNNYLLIRSVLSKCDSSIITFPLILIENESNWKELLEKVFIRTAFIKLLDELIGSYDYKIILEQICIRFLSDKIWLSALVIDSVLLSNSSETRLIQYYWDPKMQKNHLFLYNKNTWSNNDKQILISNNRNQLISHFLALGFKLEDTWRLIQGENKYFRGWNIDLKSDNMDNPIRLHFERETLIFFNNKQQIIGNKEGYNFNTGFEYLKNQLEINFPDYFIKK